MEDYKELVEALRKRIEIYGLCGDGNSKIALLLGECADAIEDLQSRVNRAIGFWDSEESANAMRSLSSFLPNIADPAWQKAHKEMGFASPLADVYEMLGVYGTEEQEETE